MIDRRPYSDKKLDVLHRHGLWHMRIGSSENIFITEFPRSGGTWFCQMLSEILMIPFPRNQNIQEQPCILHGHHLVRKEPRNTIHVLRDGRDVIVSAYHYFLLNDENSKQLTTKWKRRMTKGDYHNVEKHLPDFIHVLFKKYRSGYRKLKWNDFVNYYWQHPNVLNVKYEDLSLYPEKIMTLTSKWLEKDHNSERTKEIIDKYQFKNQSGREKGIENPNAFLRKGTIGDWKNFFNKESSEVFNFYAGEALIRAGYEKEKQWY